MSDSVDSKRTRVMPQLDCTSIPTKFASKAELTSLGFETCSQASTTADHVARRTKYNEECKTTGKHFVTYVLTDQFVAKEDLTVFKHKDKDTDYVYMLADPSRPSSFWMIPVAALADCKQFKLLTQEERNALVVKSMCQGIPIGQHLYEALTTHAPQTYTLVSASSHKRTHSADVTNDSHDSKKSKHDSEEDSAKMHDDEEYAAQMAKLTSLKVPEDAPPPSPNKTSEQPAFLKRVIGQLRKPLTVPQTRAQFVAFAAVNSLTKAEARKIASAADTDLKTGQEWQAALLKEKPTFFNMVQLISNAQDVVMTAVGALHAEDAARAAAEHAKHEEEIGKTKRALKKMVDEVNEGVAKATCLQKERDESATKVMTLQKALEEKKAELANLTDEMSTMRKDQNGQNLLAMFVDE
jgi:hypothetical protein